MARLSLPNIEDVPDDYREMLERARDRDGVLFNVFRILEHQPEALRAFFRLGDYVNRRTTVAPRLRESVILAVGAASPCRYEFAHHFASGIEAGLVEEEVAAIGRLDTGLLGEPLASVVEVTRQLTQDGAVSDAAFTKLAEQFEAGQVVDLVLLIGIYNLVSRLLAAFDIELEQTYESRLETFERTWGLALGGLR